MKWQRHFGVWNFSNKTTFQTFHTVSRRTVILTDKCTHTLQCYPKPFRGKGKKKKKKWEGVEMRTGGETVWETRGRKTTDTCSWNPTWFLHHIPAEFSWLSCSDSGWGGRTRTVNSILCCRQYGQCGRRAQTAFRWYLFVVLGLAVYFYVENCSFWWVFQRWKSSPKPQRAKRRSCGNLTIQMVYFTEPSAKSSVETIEGRGRHLRKKKIYHIFLEMTDRCTELRETVGVQSHVALLCCWPPSQTPFSLTICGSFSQVIDNQGDCKGIHLYFLEQAELYSNLWGNQGAGYITQWSSFALKNEPFQL